MLVIAEEVAVRKLFNFFFNLHVMCVVMKTTAYQHLNWRVQSVGFPSVSRLYNRTFSVRRGKMVCKYLLGSKMTSFPQFSLKLQSTGTTPTNFDGQIPTAVCNVNQLKPVCPFSPLSLFTCVSNLYTLFWAICMLPAIFKENTNSEGVRRCCGS